MLSIHVPPIDFRSEAAFFSTFVVRNPRANIVWLEGVVDLTSQASLAATAGLLRDDPKRITIDLSRVTFSDCTLVHFIDDLERGHAVQLREPTRLVSDLLAVARGSDR